MSGKKRKGLRFIRQKFPERMKRKLVMLFIAIILAFVFLIGRITYINATEGEEYKKVVLDQQQYDSRTIPFKRGDIVDCNGTKIATSERVYNVVLDAKVLLGGTKEKNRDEAIRQVKEVLVECFEIEESAIDSVLVNNSNSRYNVLKKKASYKEAQKFKEMEADDEKYEFLNGVWLEDDYQRVYPYDRLASDVIGFTVAGNVGNGGIEASYNSILNGTDGRTYGYQGEDAILERTVKPAQDGSTIVSTIDVALQSIVEKHILAFNEEHKNEARTGEGSKNTAVIIANPNTGAILAEASYPNYDLNNPRDLSAYYSEKELEKMSEKEKLEALNKIWKNFCVSDTFEPGSTAKAITVAAGLECGKLKGNESYYCGGSLTIAGSRIRCNNRSGHGMQTLSDSIANSCNVALMYEAQAMGKKEFCKYQRIFGLGQTTGIDLPGEAETAGLLYTADKMGPVELATNSFGQGFNTTMTQMMASYCSIINGGYYYKPHVVKEIRDAKGNVIEEKEPVLLRKTISKETSELMKSYMHQTMTDGTGRNAQVEGYDMGGKTGTAEKLPRGNGKYVLSYMGFAPVKNPEVLVYVVIDEPNVEAQATGKYCTDLARAIMEEAFPYLNITKATETTEE